MSSLSEVERRLTKMFDDLTIPSTGMSRHWISNIGELEGYIKSRQEVHGGQITTIVARLVSELRGSGKGTWNSRIELSEVTTTLHSIQQGLLKLDFEDYQQQHEKDRGMWYKNQTTRRLVWDDTLKSILGYDLNKMTPQDDAYQVVHPASVGYVKEQMKKLDQIGMHQFSFGIRRYDNGQNRLLTTRCHKSRVDGDVMIFGSTLDISDKLIEPSNTFFKLNNISNLIQ